jgi:uncharacterized protein (UPF0332 family)
MNADTVKLLARSSECLEEATQLLNLDHYLGSINRSYYAIFGCARALLNEKELYAKTHQGIQVKFSELYIKTGLFDQKYGEIMRHVFDLRQTSDYDLDAELSSEDAIYAIESARQFLEACFKFLNA